MPSHLCSNRLVVILLRHYCSTNLHEYWRRMRYLHMYKKWKCCRLVHGQTGRLRKVTICTITAPNNSVLCWSFVYLMKNKWINKRYKIYCRQNHFTLIASLTLDFHHTKYVRIMLLVFGRIRNCFFFFIQTQNQLPSWSPWQPWHSTNLYKALASASWSIGGNTLWVAW